MFSREEFESTTWECTYEEYTTCYCPDCRVEGCVHRDSFRRVPKVCGGLGLCPKLKEVNV